MKFSHVLPLAAASSAFVLPPQEQLQDLAIEANHRGNDWYSEAVKEKNDLVDSLKKHYEEVEDTTLDAWSKFYDSSKSALDDAFEYASETADSVKDKASDASAQVESWLRTESDDLYDSFDDPHDGPPHHGPPHHRPHHPPHHGPPNQTVYQLISESKYTTRLAKLINKYDDLVEILNSTEANYTVFAPTDKAFEKIPKHAPEPSKEVLKAILEYHVVDGFYPAGRVLAAHTAPTLLKGDHLAGEPKPQRVAFKIGLNGLTVNFYSRIIAINIFGTNGVIHGVDSLILPPPNVVKIIDLFPGEFSTLELGLGKTGLLEKVNGTDHAGGTLFAPSNFAFQKLGPKINAFLFSQYGLKYLRSLLEYHFAAGTLYSDAFYPVDPSKNDHDDDKLPPKGVFHVDMPTMLEGRSLNVDVARFGRFIEMKINGFSRVSIQDGIAQDGVVHVVSNVIIPPKNIGRPGKESPEVWEGEELTVEELKERLEPLLAKSDL
ncbi:hypothetical protein B0A50_07730 [Salinomyces thailandicus]|uniref:FAS1 domain-containing protein n=1 Tax=Salinomyces thailandicus TaxID=706561 RepID=A0A4U0TLM7_9PEZI|nr:hypothetical protein B0A50_07730 [Salinomyces thailandica]